MRISVQSKKALIVDKYQNMYEMHSIKSCLYPLIKQEVPKGQYAFFFFFCKALRLEDQYHEG